MKYTYNERLKIGKQIYEHKLNCYEAAVKYNINYYTAREYLRTYKAELKLNKVKSIEFYEVDWVKFNKGEPVKINKSED